MKTSHFSRTIGKTYATVLTIACAAAISGCAAGAAGLSSLGSNNSSASPAASSAQTVQKASVTQYVARSTKIMFLSPQALLFNSPITRSFIVSEQCRFHTPDPVFMVPAYDQPWDFAGRLDKAPHLQALQFKSWLTLGLGGGSEQLNTWPVQLVALGQMPEAYVGGNLTALSKAKLPSGDETEAVQTVLARASKIEQIVSQLEYDYSPEIECVH